MVKLIEIHQYIQPVFEYQKRDQPCATYKWLTYYTSLTFLLNGCPSFEACWRVCGNWIYHQKWELDSTLNIVYFSLFNILNIIHLKLYLYSVQFWILCVIPILTFGRTVIDLSVSSRSSRSAAPVWRTDEFAIPGGFGSSFTSGGSFFVKCWLA